jgi:negative regulator of replication initiation
LTHQLPPVDDDVYEYLLAHAIPLEDDVNTLLRRLLGLGVDKAGPDRPPSSVARRAQAAPRKPARRKVAKVARRTRALKGSILPEMDYQLPILRAIEELGGRAPSSEVIDRVGKLLEERLSDTDREAISSGDLRWRNRAQFVRLALIKAGDMKSDSPRGLWEISEQGRSRLAEQGQ